MQLLTEQQCRHYRDAGYVVVPRLFEPVTARRMIDHYMAARAEVRCAAISAGPRTTRKTPPTAIRA